MTPSVPTPRMFLGCQQEPFLGKVFYIVNGKRHWTPSAEHIAAYHGKWPDGITWVTPEELRRYPIAGWAPMPWSESDRFNPPQDSQIKMREVLGSTLRGSGVEFGAGASPFPVPIDCHVSFADFLPKEQLEQRKYRGQEDFAELSYVTSLDQMDFAYDSLDFVIACHVFEHTHNPLRVLERAYRILRPGGSLVLVVPDMRLTFDSSREVTTLDHLIDDYAHWTSDKDILHFVEFFSKAFVTPINDLYDRVRSAIATQHDIHFHTWTYESFQAMVEYSREKISPWKEIWSHPHLKIAADASEFYFLLTK